jgi:predicted lipase
MSEIHSGVVGWLPLAAAPTFAVMALTTGILGGSPGNMICTAGHASLLVGMVPMYLLMSVFHSPPWLRLISSRSRRSVQSR